MTTSTTMPSATGRVELSTGVRLAYRDVGHGEPLVTIVGTAGSLGLWAPLEPMLTDRFRMISFDNRGLGGSQRGDGPLTTASMADDTAALLEALDVDRAHVLGWSLGSAIAQELALRHPDRVASLVLYGTWARVNGFQRAMLGTMRHPWDTGDLEAGIGAMGLCFSPHLLNSPDFPQLLEPFMPMFPQTSAQAQVVSEQWDAVFAHDTLARLAEIRTPTLVSTGDEDLVTPRAQCEAVANAIPDAEVLRFDGPGSSHALHVERTEELARAVSDFLGRNPLGSRSGADSSSIRQGIRLS